MSHNEEPSLSVETLRLIDQLCDRFEAALKANERPDIQEYLGYVSDDARDVLCKELEALVQCQRRIACPGQAGTAIVLRMKTADGRESERTFAGKTSIVLGQSPEAHWILQDPQVDKLHCCITIAPPGGRVLDLGSGSGTWVNGTRRHEAALTPGDRIRIGTTEIAFALVEPTVPDATQAFSPAPPPQPQEQAVGADSTAVFSLDSAHPTGATPLTTIPAYCTKPNVEKKQKMAESAGELQIVVRRLPEPGPSGDDAALPERTCQVPTDEEPRHLAVDDHGNRVLYIDASESVHLLDMEAGTEIASFKKGECQTSFLPNTLGSILLGGNCRW